MQPSYGLLQTTFEMVKFILDLKIILWHEKVLNTATLKDLEIWF